MSNQKFGCLQDIKVLSMSAYFAGPFASALFSENGADVIHIESAKAFDNARFYRYAFTQEHRNQRNIALNIQHDAGRKAFIEMLKWCDIFLEASKGGTFDLLRRGNLGHQPQGCYRPHFRLRPERRSGLC